MLSSHPLLVPLLSLTLFLFVSYSYSPSFVSSASSFPFISVTMNPSSFPTPATIPFSISTCTNVTSYLPPPSVTNYYYNISSNSTYTLTSMSANNYNYLYSSMNSTSIAFYSSPSCSAASVISYAPIPSPSSIANYVTQYSLSPFSAFFCSPSSSSPIISNVPISFMYSPVANNSNANNSTNNANSTSPSPSSPSSYFYAFSLSFTSLCPLPSCNPNVALLCLSLLSSAPMYNSSIIYTNYAIDCSLSSAASSCFSSLSLSSCGYPNGDSSFSSLQKSSNTLSSTCLSYQQNQLQYQQTLVSSTGSNGGIITQTTQLVQNNGALVGGVFGGIVGFMVLICVIYCAMKYQSRATKIGRDNNGQGEQQNNEDKEKIQKEIQREQVELGLIQRKQMEEIEKKMGNQMRNPTPKPTAQSEEEEEEEEGEEEEEDETPITNKV